MYKLMCASLLGLMFFCSGVATYADDLPTTQSTETPSTQSAVISATDSAALQAKKGETVTIEGVVESASWSGTGKVMNVTFKDAEKGKGVMCSAFQKNKEKLDAAFGGNAGAKWTGAKVRITGKLEVYGGKIQDWKDRLQIVIQNPEQVVVVEEAAK